MNIFVFKLLLSFIIGGVVVGILSLLAEKYEAYSGAILGVPSTLALGLLFIGWTQSVDAAVKATEPIPFALCAMLFCIIVYIGVAVRVPNTIISIGFSGVVAVAAWLPAAMVTSWISVDFRWSSLILWAVCIAMFARGRHLAHLPDTRKGGSTPFLARSLFSGIIIASAVWIASIAGPQLGGIISVFPAAYLSSMMVIHRHQGPEFLVHIGASAPIGAMILFFFTAGVRYLYPAFGLLAGTALAYAIAFFALWAAHITGLASFPPTD